MEPDTRQTPQDNKYTEAVTHNYKHIYTVLTSSPEEFFCQMRKATMITHINPPSRKNFESVILKKDNYYFIPANS